MECNGNPFSMLTLCDKVGKELLGGGGGSSERLRGNLILTKLRWKVASAYFIFKG